MGYSYEVVTNKREFADRFCWARSPPLWSLWLARPMKILTAAVLCCS
ncbi:unnamed protein product [Arabidopsis lyrata]|nr:unnamed protein product [Arabidopsis lyrata]